MSGGFSITINDAVFTVDLGADVSVTPDTSLASFIRTKTNYRGTKVACAEGGCGACTVALTMLDPASGTVVTRPANACLARVLSLNGASVATNDYIGNKLVGYHPIQTKLAELNGTQCGYCASGMVMLLYCFLQENPNPTPLEVERILDGNLCRCTGYRPILDAFKSFAASGSEESLSACRKANCCQKKNKQILDVEEAHKAVDAAPSRIVKVHRNRVTQAASIFSSGGAAPPSYEQAMQSPAATARAMALPAASVWQDCATLTELTYWMQHYSGLQVILTVGATSLAIYPMEYDVYLNIRAIPELNVLSQSDTGVTIGSANSVKNVIDFLSSVTTTTAYQTRNFAAVIDHLNRLAGYSIRCRASIGGNLMVCRQHQSQNDFFPSDAAIVLLGIGATVNVLNATTGTTSNVTMSTFLSMDFTQTVLTSIVIPFAASQFQTFKSYKIAKRQVMSHALVNCAFQSTLSPLSNTLSNAFVAVGGVFAVPTRVTSVESVLNGLNVTDATAVLNACNLLKTALTAGVAPMGGRQSFRVQTAVNYLYKYLLSLLPTVPTNLVKASANWMVRPVTTSSQTFGTDPQQYPVSQPLNKIDGLTQTSGEAVFTADVAAPHGLLHAAIVQTTQANATISYVDKTAASGVVGFIKYYDSTSITTSQNTYGVAQLFTTGTANWAGQCIGVVVANTREVALQCAALIQSTVQYTNIQTPILSVQQAIAANSTFSGLSVPSVSRGNPTAAFAQCSKVVTGTLSIGSQYHCHLENNAALVQPIEGMYSVISASQSPVNCQQVVSTVLGVPFSQVQVNTRRCGGGFGAKQTNGNFTAACAAIASKDLQLPVSLELTLQDPMRGLGARPQYQYTYKLGVNSSNQVLAFEGNLSMAVGWTSPDCYGEASTALTNLDNCYNIPNFQVNATLYQTNIAPGTSVRGPGWIQAIVLTEMAMNDAANQLSIDPVAFKEANFYVQGNTLPTGMPLMECNLERVWSTVKQSANYTQRVADVAAFNAANKFVKRGLSINPTRFGVNWSWCNYNASVALYADGSIAITHGGIELGQGINTKVTQVCAYKFGLSASDMPAIRVLTATTRCAPNPTNITGGSVTSELCSLAVLHCCEILNQRIAPYRTQFPNSWAQAVGAAAAANVNMFASSTSSQPLTPTYSRYNTWGAAVSEVEVDGLTGQFEVKRTDLVYDCGISLNPYVDVGQVEGGFTFGLGWFTLEGIRWDAATGVAVDATTWEYKPPTAYEVPEVFNVTLLENSYNTSGVLSSKACGEPPVALSVSVVQALEQAMNAVRADAGLTAKAVRSLPVTVDVIAETCGLTTSHYVFS